MPPPALHPDDTTPWLDTRAFEWLPVPVAWCDAQGRLLGANAAFRAFCGLGADSEAGASVLDLLQLQGTAAAAALQQRQDAGPLPWRGHGARGQALSGLLSLRHHAQATVLTLQAAADSPDAAGPAAEARVLRERLETVQRLGRFGTWTHDLRSGEQRWDSHVWRFWGLAPQTGAPSPELAAASVLADDRAAAMRAYDESLQHLGDHAFRYRLRHPGGPLQHVRSLWQVQPGGDGLPARVVGIVMDDTETVQLVQRASDAHSQLDLVATLADIAIWQHDDATDRLTTSDLGWSLMGLPPQPQGLPMARLAEQVHPEDRPALLAQLGEPARQRAHAASAGEDVPADLGLRCRQPDGRWRYLLTRRVRRRSPDGRLLGHLGVALDLSDRHEQQVRALALAQRLEMATAAAGVGVWSVQLGTPPVVHWDEQMRVLHGLPPDSPAPALAEYAQRHVHPADREALMDGLAVLMKRSEGLLDLDLRIVRPDGEVRRISSRSSVSGGGGQRHLHGVMLDVTERYAAEERLRHADERAALAARGVGIGTWEADAEAITGWWDAQMFRLRGLERAPCLVSTEEMIHWLHPADREPHRRRMQAAVAEDRPANTEFRVVWPDGTVRWIASRSSPVRDETGKTVRRIGINWDITDARNAEAARQERLLAQRESQAKARFLARVSHELRTPLNAVLGFSQLLLAETADGMPPDPGTWRRRVEQVQASGEHLLALIDDVLELSSLESGEMPLSLQPVDLAPLAETSLPLLEPLARAHQVSLVTGPLAGWALADPVRLRQVLLNLLSNAIKYNRPGGRVCLSTEASGGWLLLRVEDTGRGLSPDQLQHLFEPFNRLGAEREGIAGTGIGLAIVQASMQHMGGTVQVRSTLGEGSVFELGLQQVAPPTSAGAGGAVGVALPPQPMPGRTPVLYIEDNEVNMMIVSELVRQRPDLQFIGAPDGGSGLAQALAEQPALILLDMQLPDMDGHEVLRRLRANPATAAIRCIALSANAMPEDIRRALEAGFDDYWTKPLDLQAFLRAMDAMFSMPTITAADTTPG